MSKLTQELVRELFDYDQETGVLTWKDRVNKGLNVPCQHNGKIAGGIDSEGYIAVGVENKTYRAHRIIWLWWYGYFPKNDIDHVDRVRHHNWLKNLRESSRKFNNQNSVNPRNNTSGVKGVTWKSNPKLWAAQISIDNKSKHIGYFKDFDDAVCARLATEQCLGWANCDSSSPAFQHVQKILNRG